jgi:CNT family concentrative nucleoside transporter
MGKWLSLLGIFGFVGIAYAFSRNRSKIDWKLVATGIGLQLFFAVIVLKTTPGEKFFFWVNGAVEELLGYTDKGSAFVFGEKLLDPSPAGFGSFIFAVKVLPTIVFFSALMGLLYHLGVMQFIVNIISKVMVKALGTSGAETLSASANIFVGQTEAPLLIKPYVSKMTQSELMVVMTGGFATVAGGVLAAYVALLKPFFPEIAGHLMAASIMSAPAALVMAKIIVPETEEPATKGAVKIEEVESQDANAIEAAANGAGVGLQLAMNVGAMLLAFIALIAMFNGILGFFGGFFGYPDFNLSVITSYLFAPLALLMGVPLSECLVVGDLLGKKLILNEFVAYSELATMLNSPNNPLSGRTVVILTYALCGFANLSSIGIQIGGIGGIAPERKGDLARLGLIAVLAGTLACFQTATIAGVLITEEESRLVTTQTAPNATPSPPISPNATESPPMPEADPQATPSPDTFEEETEELSEETEIKPLTPSPGPPDS